MDLPTQPIADVVDLSAAQVIERLIGSIPGLSPQQARAASYIAENPGVVGVQSLRQIAVACDVKPNTLVRLARSLGFNGFEALRRPFQEEIIDSPDNFPNRAQRLQSLMQGNEGEKLFSDMAQAAIGNLEKLYTDLQPEALKEAAATLLGTDNAYVLGVGIAHVFARNFAYIAGMAVNHVHEIPRDGLLPVDTLLRANPGDVLLAMTFKPFRREVVEAVELAKQRGMKIIAISDSAASPILQGADHHFLIPTDTPQFFTSTIALSALLETLSAYLIAATDRSAVENIKRFHQRRLQHGIYWSEI